MDEQHLWDIPIDPEEEDAGAVSCRHGRARLSSHQVLEEIRMGGRNSHWHHGPIRTKGLRMNEESTLSGWWVFAGALLLIAVS